MFFYVGCLLYLSSMNLDYPISEMDRSLLRKIVNYSVEWATEELHTPIMGVVPECEISSRLKEVMAKYDDKTHTIVLGVKQIDTLRELLQSFLHEWFHSTKDSEEYWDLHQKYGYENHPHEKGARRYEKFYHLLYPHLCERLGTSPTVKDKWELWWGSLSIKTLGV